MSANTHEKKHRDLWEISHVMCNFQYIFFNSMFNLRHTALHCNKVNTSVLGSSYRDILQWIGFYRKHLQETDGNLVCFAMKQWNTVFPEKKIPFNHFMEHSHHQILVQKCPVFTIRGGSLDPRDWWSLEWRSGARGWCVAKRCPWRGHSSPVRFSTIFWGEWWMNGWRRKKNESAKPKLKGVHQNIYTYIFLRICTYIYNYI